jgi:hypothetical protein
VEKQTIGVSKADGDKILSAKFAKSDFGVSGDCMEVSEPFSLILFGVRFPMKRMSKEIRIKCNNCDHHLHPQLHYCFDCSFDSMLFSLSLQIIFEVVPSSDKWCYYLF